MVHAYLKRMPYLKRTSYPNIISEGTTQGALAICNTQCMSSTRSPYFRPSPQVTYESSMTSVFTLVDRSNDPLQDIGYSADAFPRASYRYQYGYRAYQNDLQNLPTTELPLRRRSFPAAIAVERSPFVVPQGC